ncbi:3-deoxy-D-manno-octulosonic acid transferase [Amylibacter marinus]|uniref:3-deoxy-D-manno-octulosonic acid transferase n=1 Tax=Amylibacter marinus TaxID=1475483 RepID=A0ABQ5VTD0_9RHOB|nr:glycosyltransferase N-terminal domain-containing protein [Amylibacter marinus]GLQ34688.1 3-deoxy-D-manno-octulosonic acid transferase [Amylibacter marinus]
MPSEKNFPSLRLRCAMLPYKLFWLLGLPFALIYLFLRGRKDRLYTQFLGERFGFYRQNLNADLWVHAVSLGELRSAAPIIQAFLDRGQRVVVSNFTPAGRRETMRMFEGAITAGDLAVVYAPAEYHWCYARFFRAFKPNLGLVMEVELWPQMVFSARRAGVALFLCNSQYPEHSFKRDSGRILGARGDLIAGYAGVLAKSEIQEARFRAFGASNVEIMGETRFDQPIAPHLLDASAALTRLGVLGARPVVTLASVVVGEDAIYLQAIEQIQARARKAGNPLPLFIYVPRAPERFEECYELLIEQGQRVERRCDLFDENLNMITPVQSQTDVLLGDSLGEMYFYLDLCHAAIVGGGFLDSGAHNIIEPLALAKPVFVGPVTWSIEYPAQEALQAGVLAQVASADELAERLYERLYELKDRDHMSAKAAAFFQAHEGGGAKAVAHLPDMLVRAGYQRHGAKMKDVFK